MIESELKSCYEQHESEARAYCRTYDKVFAKGVESYLWDNDGKRYIDFLSGAGALNYGHNNRKIKHVILDYIEQDGIMMSLDMHTVAKSEFIKCFSRHILQPRGLDYKMQFTSPTGTSCIESAIKLARKSTKRRDVISFTNGFHGMTGTSLGLTGSSYHRQSGVVDTNIIRMPFDGYLPAGFDLFSYMSKLFDDPSSGIELPAAFILEVVQGEGGLNVASPDWLRKLESLANAYGILLIVDDIQAGCGRSGRFFSFESAGIKPDIVCLSKSIGAYGLPLALLLMRRDIDCWNPAEDNGTFRGNCLGFVAAKAMIDEYWVGPDFAETLKKKIQVVDEVLARICVKHVAHIVGKKGAGLMSGIEFHSAELPKSIIERCFSAGLILESCGPRGEVLKLMPALTIDETVLQDGLGVLLDSVDLVVQKL